MNKTDLVEKSYLRSDIPSFRPGDTVKVHVRVVEGSRERVQVFQGVVIGRQNGGLRETFTVRKISFGVGVERTFPVHSPSIAKLEIVSRGQVRRAKLYYLRELRGKKARIKERRIDDDEACRHGGSRRTGRCGGSSRSSRGRRGAVRPSKISTRATDAAGEVEQAPRPTIRRSRGRRFGGHRGHRRGEGRGLIRGRWAFRRRRAHRFATRNACTEPLA